jgi:hypothetical protein
MFTCVLQPGDPLPSGRLVAAWFLRSGGLYVIVERGAP